MRRVGILAVSEINEAIDRQVVSQTLAALQSSAASLSHVDSSNAMHYQQLLARIKSEKAQVETSMSVSAVRIIKSEKLQVETCTSVSAVSNNQVQESTGRNQHVCQCC